MFKALKRLLHLDSGSAQRSHNVECACCGHCCDSFGGHLHASKNDLERWQVEGRDDLLEKVNRLGWVWVDPQTKQLIDPCPFIKQIEPGRRVCSINNTKPDICRDYPTLAHGHRCLTGVFLKP